MSVDEPGGMGATPRHPELSRWKSVLHTPFVFRLDTSRCVELTLDEIASFDVRPGWESFSLIFGGPCPPAFSDGMFDVEHAELGSFPLFVAAVLTDGDNQQYQAIFYRRCT